MSDVYVISDLHLGHKNILKFAGTFRYGSTVDEHDDWLVEQWNSVVTKRDWVWVLGDVAFNKDALHLMQMMRGNKRLILGNHDMFPLGLYNKYFVSIHGLVSKSVNGRRAWLSHAPIHQDELRGCKNIHGHVHMNYIVKQNDDYKYARDDRYVNACVEASYGVPRKLTDLVMGD